MEVYVVTATIKGKNFVKSTVIGTYSTFDKMQEELNKLNEVSPNVSYTAVMTTLNEPLKEHF